jgi:hypothetical protein
MIAIYYSEYLRVWERGVLTPEYTIYGRKGCCVTVTGWNEKTPWYLWACRRRSLDEDGSCSDEEFPPHHQLPVIPYIDLIYGSITGSILLYLGVVVKSTSTLVQVE